MDAWGDELLEHHPEITECPATHRIHWLVLLQGQALSCPKPRTGQIQGVASTGTEPALNSFQPSSIPKPEIILRPWQKHPYPGTNPKTSCTPHLAATSKASSMHLTHTETPPNPEVSPPNWQQPPYPGTSPKSVGNLQTHELAQAQGPPTVLHVQEEPPETSLNQAPPPRPGSTQS